MEPDSEMSLIQLFHIHWPYDKDKILLNCVEHMTLKYMGKSLSLTDVVSDLMMEYNTISLTHDEIIYKYNSLFSKYCCANNSSNVKSRFEITIKNLKLR